MGAVLRVALLAGRELRRGAVGGAWAMRGTGSGARWAMGEAGVMPDWRIPAAGGRGEAAEDRDDASSNPVTTFWAGRLPRVRGMAVIVLAGWLVILHVSGVVGG